MPETVIHMTDHEAEVIRSLAAKHNTTGDHLVTSAFKVGVTFLQAQDQKGHLKELLERE